MDELYKTVIKGKYEPFPEFYSTDLQKVIKQLIKVSPSKRPSCRVILNFPVVQKWAKKMDENNDHSRLSMYKANSPSLSKNASTNSLMKTITFSKGFKNLSKKLPAPKYLDVPIESHPHTIDDIRRESLNIYSNMPNPKKKEKKDDSFNISIKRTRRDVKKKNYDILDIEISNPSEDQSRFY